jgi:N-acetylglutamate synthase-like GNAT family acetyltransferase
MTFGNKDYKIRKAIPDDIKGIKALADKHKVELGFVIQGALLKSIKANQMLVCVNCDDEIIGFTQYRHRKDKQTTLYNIVVAPNIRRNSIGSALIDALCVDAVSTGKQVILLKCPQELEANKFYKSYGFECIDIENGKKRPLCVWLLNLTSE